jgi:hypothetical protein
MSHFSHCHIRNVERRDRNVLFTGLSSIDSASYVICEYIVRLEVITALTMKNAVLWDETPCGFCKNRRFGGTYRLHHHTDNNQRARNNVSSN